MAIFSVRELCYVGSAVCIDLEIVGTLKLIHNFPDLRLHPLLAELRGDDPGLDHGGAGLGLADQ